MRRSVRITSIVLCLVLLHVILGFSLQATSAAQIPGFEVAAQNEYLSLFFNSETTEVAVHDRISDVTWYSNPVDRDQMETIARGSAKDALGAQLRITYFTPGDVRRNMNNYNDSIAYGQFAVEELPDGVRVEYILGKQWEEDDYFPVVLDEDTYESVLSSLNRRDQNLIRGNYVHLNLVHAGEEGAVGSYVIDSPSENLRSRDQATFAQVLSEHIAAQSSAVSHRRDVRDQHLEKFAQESFYMLRARKGDLLAWDREDLIALFKEMEFTPLDVGAIYERFGLDPLVPNMFTFTIPIEYRIEGDNLVVRIPTEGIQYPRNILSANNQRVTYPLVAVDVLPYFGAAHSSEEGYMFVPDGPGAIIHLNNGKLDASPFGGVIYGRDYGLTAPPASLARGQQCYLPVFGMKKGNQALFGIIEEGDAIAQVNADISGRQISYNMVYPQFRTMAQTTAQLQGEMPEEVHGQASQWVNTSQRMINVYQQELFPGDLTIRYGFLEGEDADYVGMAHYYQDYLVERYGLTPQDQQGEDIPLFVELVGAINDIRPILGIPLPIIEPLTTFRQAEDLVHDLLEQGISQIKLTYSGWLDKGINHTVPSKVRLEDFLGTEVEFVHLANFLEREGVELYPTVDFMLVHRSKFGDFSGRADASRFLNRASAVVDRQYVFCPATFEIVQNRSWVLSPPKLPNLINSFAQDYEQYEIDNIALKDMGYLLNSDFRQGEVTYRHEAKDVVTQELAKLVSVHGLGLQVSGGNAYTIPFADSIINLPTESGQQDLVDEAVPFFPIVIRGFVDYAAEPINFAADYDTALLKTIETGAYPYFLGFYRDSSFLKHTTFNYLYTGHTAFWLDDAVEVYHRLNADLKDFVGQPIVGHHRLRDNVYQTSFPNGVVIVNYNSHAVVIDDYRIEPRGYLVVRGDDV